MRDSKINGHKRTDEEQEDQFLRKNGRKGRKRLDVVLSKQFTPRFLEDADSRLSVVRLIRKRIELLKEHAGADSFQKEILCSRAVFVSVMLETAETEGLEGKGFDMGSYTQMTNCLKGLLSALGLERKMKKAGSLKDLVKEQS